jgi:ribose transport system ATP-binding protein
VERAEIHALVGENGSGKSTLIKILAGFHAPDPGGAIAVNGRRVGLPLRPEQCAALGMSFLHQDLALFPSLSVAENLMVGELSATSRWRYRPTDERRRALLKLSSYGLAVDPAAKVRELSLPNRAKVALVRAIEQTSSGSAETENGRLLVLDEPTASLAEPEACRIMALVQELARSGVSVLLISHDIDAALRVADRLTVLRDGRVVATRLCRDTTVADVVNDMIGQRQAHSAPQARPRRRRRLVSARGLADHGISDLAFDIAKGEILGFTGAAGSSFERVPRLLFGAGQPVGGTLEIDGASHNLQALSPQDAVRAGIALVPADRDFEGAVGSLSVCENLMLGVMPRYQRRLKLRRRLIREEAQSQLIRFGVRPTNPNMPFAALSGGNQQKVVLAKWLLTKPTFLILHEPTAGVDIAAREEIADLIRAIAADGTAILYVSADSAELARICHRVLVLGPNGIRAELAGAELTRDRISGQCLG